MNISKVEDFIAYTMTQDMLKSAVGDGMEFELMYQALLDSMENKAESQESNNKNVNTTTYTNISGRLDKMPMVMKGQSLSEVYGREPLDFDLNQLNYNINRNYAVNNTMNSNLQATSANFKVEGGSEMERIYSAVDKYSKKYGVDKNLVLSIIKQESNFNPNAESYAGAKGLMQLMDFNSEAYGIENPFDIEANIEGGVRHIRSYLDMFDGNTQMALMAYNGGPGTMNRRGVESISDLYKMPQETQNYVVKVMNYYQNGLA